MKKLIRPRQFSDFYISCINNGLLRHWLDLQNHCPLDILKRLRKLSQQRIGDTSEMYLRCLLKISKQRFCQTLFRFAKKLSSMHLENISGKCLAVWARELFTHFGNLKVFQHSIKNQSLTLSRYNRPFFYPKTCFFSLITFLVSPAFQCSVAAPESLRKSQLF